MASYDPRNPQATPMCSLRCALGFHTWTHIPKDVQEAAAAAGLRSPPLGFADGGDSGYFGHRGPKRCWRCGVEA